MNVQAREIQKAKMENENDSELGNLLLEGERGSRFYLGGCLAIFLVAFMAALSCFLLLYMFHRKSLTGDVAMAGLISLFTLPFTFILLAGMKDGMEARFQVYENGIFINKKKLTYPEIKYFVYKPFGYRSPNSIHFYSEGKRRKPHLLASTNISWQNENAVLQLIRQKIVEINEDDFYSRFR